MVRLTKELLESGRSDVSLLLTLMHTMDNPFDFYNQPVIEGQVVVRIRLLCLIRDSLEDCKRSEEVRTVLSEKIELKDSLLDSLLNVLSTIRLMCEQSGEMYGNGGDDDYYIVKDSCVLSAVLNFCDKIRIFFSLIE